MKRTGEKGIGAMGAFIVSLFAGIFWPFFPIMTEYGLTNHVKSANLTITAVVYAAAVGLMSRNQAVAFSSFGFAALCAVIYGADEMGIQGTRPDTFFALYDSTITFATIYFYSACYFLERFSRHVIDNEPFVEI